MRHSYYRQRSLAPLRDEAVGELLGGLLGVEVSLTPLLAFVLERTAGNPFFVEEVVRATPTDECPALLARARARCAAREPQDAVAAELGAALTLARRIGALTYEPFIREELARVRGDDAEFREALRLFTAIGATGHARRLEAEPVS